MADGKRRPSGGNSKLGWARVPGGLLALAIVVLFLGTSLPAAGAGARMTTFKPAYTGYTYFNGNDTRTGCGAFNFHLVIPVPSLTTGLFPGWATTNASSGCAPPGTSSSSYAYADEHLDVILGHSPTTGAQQVVSSWVNDLGGSVESQPGGASTYAYSAFYGTIEPYLVDRTNGSVLYPTSRLNWTIGSSSTNTSACAAFVCSYSVHATLKFWWNSTFLNSSHIYWFEVDLVTLAEAKASGSTSVAIGNVDQSKTKLASIALS